MLSYGQQYEGNSNTHQNDMELDTDSIAEAEADFEAGWNKDHIVNDDNDEWNDTTKESPSSSDRNGVKHKLDSSVDYL